MRQLNPRESRLVAIAILIAVVALAWIAIIQPVAFGIVARDEQREALQLTHARNARVLAALPVWRHEADQQRRTASAFTIAAPTEALAAEVLKTRVGKTVSEGGGRVTAIQNVDTDVPAGSVRVRANFIVTLSQLYHVLGRLESEEPYVIVDYISIAADRAFQTGQPAPMDVSLEISAVRTAVAQ